MSNDDVKLYNPHDGLTGRDGGPYLDQEERRLAEIVRAAKEDREPDFEKAPATAGTPLVTAAELVRMANPASIPSQNNEASVDPFVSAVQARVDDGDTLLQEFSSRKKTDQEKENEEKANSASIHNNPANATVVSTNDGDDNGVRDVEQENDKTPAKESESPSAKAKQSDQEKASAPVLAASRAQKK